MDMSVPVPLNCIAVLPMTQCKPYIAARYPVTPKSVSGDLEFREVEKSLGQFFFSHVNILATACTVGIARYPLFLLLSKGYLLFDNRLPLRSADELDTELGE